MKPEDFSPELMEQAQTVLKAYNQIYPTESDRRLFPEMIEAIKFCHQWQFTTAEIIEAIERSTLDTFWSALLSRGSLTGFLKPRHLESVRHQKPEDADEKERQEQRWEEQDATRKERQSKKGFDADGNPILRVAV